jgi:hypothetical protein
MTVDGYSVAGFDGPAPHGFLWNLQPRPPVIAHVRPDLWGICDASGAVAIGEAKTFDDVDTAHTRDQLRVFTALRDLRSGRRCRVYVAVPRSAVFELDRVLRDIGILDCVSRVHVPDCLLTEYTSAHA